MDSGLVQTASDTALLPRKATRERLPAIAETLALSFYDDPLMMWCIPEGPRRREILPDLFGAIGDSYLSGDEVYELQDAVSVAVWAPPGAEDDEESGERVGEIMAENADRAFELMGLMAEKHPVEPHYYLFLLGTTPERQGQGLGSTLMKPVLDKCDRDGVPAYLEATSEANKRLYLRHGFEVTDEIQVPDGPTLWCMWRTPRPGDEAERA